MFSYFHIKMPTQTEAWAISQIINTWQKNIKQETSSDTSVHTVAKCKQRIERQKKNLIKKTIFFLSRAIIINVVAFN